MKLSFHATYKSRSRAQKLMQYILINATFIRQYWTIFSILSLHLIHIIVLISSSSFLMAHPFISVPLESSRSAMRAQSCDITIYTRPYTYSRAKEGKKGKFAIPITHTHTHEHIPRTHIYVRQGQRGGGEGGEGGRLFAQPRKQYIDV